MVVLPVLPCSQLLRRWEHKSLCTPSPGPRRAPSARSGWSWWGLTPAGSSLHPEALRKWKYRSLISRSLFIYSPWSPNKNPFSALHYLDHPTGFHLKNKTLFWIRPLLVRPSPEMSLLTPEGYTAATVTEYWVSGSSFCRMMLVFFPPTCVCSQETCHQWVCVSVLQSGVRKDQNNALKMQTLT